MGDEQNGEGSEGRRESDGELMFQEMRRMRRKVTREGGRKYTLTRRDRSEKEKGTDIRGSTKVFSDRLLHF